MAAYILRGDVCVGDGRYLEMYMVTAGQRLGF